MATDYRVVDLRQDPAATDGVAIGASSPEAAALRVLGIELVRSGARNELAAKVYWQIDDHPVNMVRLYHKIVGDRRR
jgi:hypothetical protein